MHPEAMRIKTRMAQLSTTSGFALAWWELVGAGYSHREAWELLEGEFFNLFGRYCYSSFDSFRVVRNRLLKSHHANHSAN
jgi:hypothetical protein